MDQAQNDQQTFKPELSMFPSPVTKFDLSHVGEEFAGAHIEYVPFEGYDVLSLETRPQNEAVTAFYELLEKYATKVVMPVRQADGSFNLQEVDRKEWRRVPYAYILKFVQSAIQGELPANFTKQ